MAALMADEPRDGDGYKPGDKDIPEQMPVNSLPWAQSSNSNHRTHLSAHNKNKFTQHYPQVSISSHWSIHEFIVTYFSVMRFLRYGIIRHIFQMIK